jgi:hypothetical protein
MDADIKMTGTAQAPWMERVEEPQVDDPIRPFEGILAGLVTGGLLWLGLAWLLGSAISG